MDDKLNAAIEVLVAKLDEQMRSVIDTKKMINSLRQMNGEEPLYHDTELEQSQIMGLSRPDIFYGKPFATAAREYLEMRKRSCLAEEVLRGLEQGGFDFNVLGWKEKDRLRSLAISLAKNTTFFHKLPNGTFGLLSWYPEVAKRKSEREKTPEANTEEG
jgi:hypothetical protein